MTSGLTLGMTSGFALSSRALALSRARAISCRALTEGPLGGGLDSCKDSESSYQYGVGSGMGERLLGSRKTYG